MDEATQIVLDEPTEFLTRDSAKPQKKPRSGKALWVGLGTVAAIVIITAVFLFLSGEADTPTDSDASSAAGLPDGTMTQTTPTEIPQPTRTPREIAAVPDVIEQTFACQWRGLGRGICFKSQHHPLEQILADEAPEIMGLSWNPNGDRITYSKRLGDFADIYIINKDGSDNQLFVSGANDIEPAWSHDGEWIAYHSNCDLKITHISGRPTRTLIASNNQRDNTVNCTVAPTWSPDGKHIVTTLFYPHSQEFNPEVR